MASHDGDSPAVLDVLIVGAGPCGLAVASRLCERSPSAIFTDEEHQRYHWIKKHGRRMSLKCRKSGDVIPSRAGTGARSSRLRYKTLVLDATGDAWMNRWNTLFATFGITHLRSPMFWHVDPAERDSLLAMAYELNRQDDLVELKGCVGKEVSKHLRKARASRNPRHHSVVEINERERNDYFTPPQWLFAGHNQRIAERYGLQDGLVRHERVQDIEYGVFPAVSRDEKLFRVQGQGGATHYARVVVMAVGPGNAARIPAGIEGLSPRDGDGDGTMQTQPPRTSHAMRIQHGQVPDPEVRALIDGGRDTHVLVVGGGLTSAQLSDLNLRRGVRKVWHLMRSTVRIKAFDVDLAWMGKFRNVEQAHFWGAESDEERLGQIRAARGGGSIPPLYWKRLKAHMAAGRLELRQATRLVAGEFDAASRTWAVRTEPALPDLPRFDFVYFATGVEADVATLPCLRTLMRTHPVPAHGGLPCLTEDLMWRRDVPLFVAGRFAGLRLGPAAANLGGARMGAERISWALDELLEERLAEAEDGVQPEIYDGDDKEDDELAFVTGRNNRYRRLAVEEGDDW